MISTPDAGGSSLAAEVIAVPGVVDVFPARPLAQALPGIVAGALGIEVSGRPDDVVVDPRGETTSVEARIGTDAGLRTADAARAVADLLSERVESGAEIIVRVVRIH